MVRSLESRSSGARVRKGLVHLLRVEGLVLRVAMDARRIGLHREQFPIGIIRRFCLCYITYTDSFIHW